MIPSSPIGCGYQICHIGARDGYIPIAFSDHFDGSISFILIDASDSPNIKEVVLSTDRRSTSKFNIVNAVIWDGDGCQRINIRSCSYASGISTFDPSYNGWYVYGNGGVDYILGDAHHVEESIEVETKALDSLEIEGVALHPSVLCIDAQGASFSILKGALLTLLYVDVVIVECEMIPFYGGTPSFNQVNELLLEQGFFLSSILDEDNRWANPNRAPIGLRGSTLMGSVDAVFVRNPRTIEKCSLDRKINYAFSLSLVGHLDIGMAPLFKKGESAVFDVGSSNGNSIHQYVKDICDVMNSYEWVYPTRFGVTPTEDVARLSGSYELLKEIRTILLRYGFVTLSDTIISQGVAALNE
jgi:FkbM family methyltransferase